MHWDGHEYIVQRAASFAQSAEISGTSGEEVAQWHRRMESLGVDMIATVRATKDGIPFNYLETENFPGRDPSAFALRRAMTVPLNGNYCPGPDSPASRDTEWMEESSGSGTRTALAYA